MNRKIILTGATGFIGGHLLQSLVKNHHQVWAVHRKTTATQELNSLLQPHQWISYQDRWEDLAERFAQIQPDVVIHLASRFVAEHQPADVTSLIQSNILFPTHLLEAMDQSKCRNLINTGTMWQHFNNRLYSPICLYAATKQAFEDLGRFYVEARNFRIIHLHLSDSYGPGDRRRKLLNVLKEATHTMAPLSMSQGEQPLDFVHVSDIVNCFNLSLEHLLNPNFKGEETYHVYSGQALKLRDIVGLVERLTGKKLNVEWGARPYRQREMMTEWTMKKPLPGWKPQILLEAGLRDFLCD